VPVSLEYKVVPSVTPSSIVSSLMTEMQTGLGSGRVCPPALAEDLVVHLLPGSSGNALVIWARGVVVEDGQDRLRGYSELVGVRGGRKGDEQNLIVFRIRVVNEPHCQRELRDGKLVTQALRNRPVVRALSCTEVHACSPDGEVSAPSDTTIPS